MKDRFESAGSNLRADGYNKLSRLRAEGKSKNKKLALLFFQKYPNMPIKQMDLSDFRRENPDFTIMLISTLKGLHTILKKDGLL